MSLFYLPPLSFLTQEIEKAFPLSINYIYSYQHSKDISYVIQKNRDGRFGSEADISQGWPKIRALGSAYGQKRTLATQKETRREAGS